MKTLLFLVIITSTNLLVGCAVQEDDNYQLTADEMQNVGNATLSEKQNAASLYQHAEFVKPQARGKQ